MTLLFAIITMIFALIAAHEVRRTKTWRELYLHEQRERNETQERLAESDHLLSEYAHALERRDAVLLVAQRRLNAANKGLAPINYKLASS